MPGMAADLAAPLVGVARTSWPGAADAQAFGAAGNAGAGSSKVAGGGGGGSGSGFNDESSPLCDWSSARALMRT